MNTTANGLCNHQITQESNVNVNDEINNSTTTTSPAIGGVGGPLPLATPFQKSSSSGGPLTAETSESSDEEAPGPFKNTGNTSNPHKGVSASQRQSGFTDKATSNSGHNHQSTSESSSSSSNNKSTCIQTPTTCIPDTARSNQSNCAMMSSPGTTTSLLVTPRVACQVIKGEIHNLLTLLRADRRYTSGDRLEREHQTSFYYNNNGGDDDYDDHQVVAALCRLGKQLSHSHQTTRTSKSASASSSERLSSSSSSASSSMSEMTMPPARVFLEPFLRVITTQEVSAVVTGAALAAVQKFLLYGLLLSSNPTTSSSSGSGSSSSSSSSTANESITTSATGNSNNGLELVAQALLHCTFEETEAVSRNLMASVRNAAGGGGNNASSLMRHRHHNSSSNDECVVLRLLDLAGLVVRTGLPYDLLSPTSVVGLVETCWHVSHKASAAPPLLQCQAHASLSQIVLQVFSTSSGNSTSNNNNENNMEARFQVLSQLAQLLNPATHNEVVTVSTLQALNMALETLDASEVTDREIGILQTSVCKYLLQWSTSQDLVVLALTLRVIFNLLRIQHHLKVPLEVFITSVHLRLVNAHANNNNSSGVHNHHNGGGSGNSTAVTAAASVHSATSSSSHQNVTSSSSSASNPTTSSSVAPAHCEIALESLLEFCQEPALMRDLYRNYDCDVMCTNLYQSVVTALGRAARPPTMSGGGGGGRAPNTKVVLSTGGTATTNSTDDDIIMVNHSHNHHHENGSVVSGGPLTASDTAATTIPTGPSSSATAMMMPPPNLLNGLAMDCLLAILDSIESRCGDYSAVMAKKTPALSSTTTIASSEDIDNNDDNDKVHSDEKDELADRKLRKHALTSVAEAFNARALGDEWKHLAVQQGLLDDVTNPKGVAELLFTAPGVDKVELGIYLSKGPDEKYPFIVEARQHFLGLYDFTGLPFASALRKFLSKFRLPGEAQCIDRFMEAFSKTMYSQEGESSIFKDADSVYVLSFSTIMLNTDLHNPTIKEENRMTCAQFLRNNRGINGGENLPEDFLVELYDQIKENQIQVRRELGEIIKNENDDVRTAWESILAKTSEVAAPCFTPMEAKLRVPASSDVHDKEMFLELAKWILYAIPVTFQRSLDDGTVLKAMRGLQKTAKLAAYFELNSVLDQVVAFLLTQGREYIADCVVLDSEMTVDGNTSAGSNLKHSEHAEEDDTTTNDAEDDIPYGLLSSTATPSEADDVTGAASHRGLLAMEGGLTLIRDHPQRISGAWVGFVECMCSLRDAKALPASLSALDDFADSNGNALPLSPFAKKSKRKLEEYYRSKVDPDDTKAKKGWFRGFFKKNSKIDDESIRGDEESVTSRQGDPAFHARILRSIVEATEVERVVQSDHANREAPKIVAALLGAVEKYPFGNNPVEEQYAVYSLELATRALLDNRDSALELFTMFLNTFERVFGHVSEKAIAAPFLLERIVVTVLRASIHLYDQEQLRPHLRASLHLLLMSLPRSFLRQIADRMACGLAIILRASYHHFETANDWTFLGENLDMLAAHSMSRVFVFDGIASTVEHALPEPDEEAEERPMLSVQAISALAKILTRFVLGFYQRDVSLQVPAMLCLEKLYRHKVGILLKENPENDVKDRDPLTLVPDKDMWQNNAVAVYAVCRSPDPEVSQRGIECFQRIVLQSAMDQIPQDKWIAVLYLMVNKQPPTAADASRGNSFALLGQMVSKVLPELSYSEENREDLTDLIHMTTALAEDNLRQGRRGSVSPLFEQTLRTVTYLSNSMVADEWKGEPEFSSWASECLLYELEKIGAAGAAIQNQVATTKVASSPPPASPQRMSSEHIDGEMNCTSHTKEKNRPLSSPDDPSEHEESQDEDVSESQIEADVDASEYAESSDSVAEPVLSDRGEDEDEAEESSVA